MMKYVFIALTLTTSNMALSHIHSTNLWTNYEVKTCFAQHEFRSPMKVGKHAINVTGWPILAKKKIQVWVKEDFSYEKTGINFVGFKDCEDNQDYDVFLFYSNLNSIQRDDENASLPPGVASVGMTSGLMNIRKSAAKAYIALTTSGLNKRTVIHEFGHVAGLQHEHLHPDAIKAKPHCIYVPSKEKIKDEHDILEYDKSSVMDYCTFSHINMAKGLSPKDVQVLKYLYP